MPPLIPQDPSLIQRQRPNTDDFVKNSKEEDLWDLADLSDAAEQAAPVPMQPRRSLPGILPLAPDKGESPTVDGDKSGMPVLPIMITPRFQSRQSVNVARLGRISPVRPSLDPSEPEAGAAVGTAAPENLFEDTFDNLEDWVDAENIPVPISADNLRAVPEVGTKHTLPPTAQGLSVPPTAQGASNPTAEAPGTAVEEVARSIEPIVKPLSLRPHLGLSKLEAVSLIILVLLLLVGGYWVYDHSLNRVLGQVGQLAKVTFPVRGTHITVNSVASYWRKPLKDGNRIDAVRRGVVLIPVAEITLQGGPGAIRALVLNENGLAVGDPITRAVDGTTTLTLSATDGFEDISLHAAYRTGQTQPWTLRIFEASSANAQGKEFKKLLELPISSDKH